jgi:YD repeat-containing protein
MRLSGNFIFRALLALTAICLFTTSVNAKEYIAAKKLYLYANQKFEPQSAEMKYAISGNVCNQPVYVGCTSLFMSESWDPASSQWTWLAIVSYTRKYPVPQYPPDTPDQQIQTKVWSLISYSCPTSGGWSLELTSTLPVRCSRATDQDPDCEICKRNRPPQAAPPIVGNPIFPSTLMKQEVEIDYANAKGTLSFIRTYRSNEGKWSNNYQLAVLDLNTPSSGAPPDGACVLNSASFPGGAYCHPYTAVGNANDVAVRRGGKSMRYFSSSANFGGALDDQDRLTKLTDSNGVTIGWSVKNGSTEATEIYGTDGRIQSSKSRQGLITSYVYSDLSTPPEIAPAPGILLKVIDHYGDALSFSYNSNAHSMTMTTPAGEAYLYLYDGLGNITSVTYPDGHTRTYLYNEADKMGGIRSPLTLTGIVDENGSRYATFRYNSSLEAISTEHANGVEKYQLNLAYSTQTTVTDPLGTVRQYNFASKALGKKRYTGLTQPAPGGTGSVSSSISYDANVNVSSITDLAGTRTTYAYDLSRNLETSRVEAEGTALARTITTEWHPSWNLPTRIAEPKRRSVYTYDDNGNLLTKSIQATTDATGAAAFSAVLSGTARVWTYTYNERGQMLSVKGPRTDVNDVTTYAYDDKGNLSSVTNAAGHVTTFSNYDADGKIGRITDPNGLVTDFSYTARGWLASRTVGSESTTYTYDNVGQMTQVTMPDGATVSYTYDPAHRLTGISDNLGNSIAYTLDNMGNRTLETVNDSSGILARKISRIYDALNNVKQQTGGVQ